jgi:hypothetical protein
MNQIGNVLVQGTKRRLYVGCLTVLIGIPMIICGFIFLFTVVLPGFDEIIKNGNEEIVPVLLLGLAVILIFLFLGLPTLIYILQIRSRAKRLDAIFFPVGLKGELYLIVGRHYWGSINGRDIDIYIYRGPSMEIHISANTNTRVLVLPNKTLPVKISGIFNKQPMQTAAAEYEKYSLYPDDENWAKQLIQQKDTLSLFDSLVYEHADWAIFRHLEIQSDRIMLYLHRSKNLFTNLNDFSAAATWLKSLYELAEIVENLPAPSHITQPVLAYSRSNRRNTNKIQLYVILFILICIPIACIGVGVLTYLLVSL